MRLCRRNQRIVVIKKRIFGKELDGTTYEDWEPIGVMMKANIQPAGGRMMTELYGLRLTYMLTMIVPIHVNIRELDGVCVFVLPDSLPDYKVIAVRTWSQHKALDLERI